MNTFETSARVEAEGQVRVTGVPFEPGTPVEVTITPLAMSSSASIADQSERVSKLFAALDKARNTQTVGPLRRKPREGWAESFKAMAEAGDDVLPAGPQTSLSQFDDEEWEW